MNLSAEIQAVTFDVGGTLIEPQGSVGHLYAEVAARHGWRDLPPDVLNSRFREAWKAHPRFQHTRLEWAQIVDQTFDGLIEPPPSRTFFPELFERFAQPDAWRVYDDVFPALDLLASHGFKLGVISNWDDRLRPLLQRLRLASFFEAIVVSWEVGFGKPSPIIFEHAARKLALPPGSILHVGDDLEMDLQGARAAGLKAALLRRSGPEPADGGLRSLNELGEVL